MRGFVIALLFLINVGAVRPGLADSSNADLTQAQALRELRLLKHAFLALHPGLYRYRTPEEINAEFAAAEQTVSTGASIAQMYLLASRLAAAVRCGHTWTNPLNQSEAVQQRLFLNTDKLPVRVRVIENRFLVTASSDPQLRAGDELVAIDGRSAGSLILELLPYLRADGSNDGKRISQIDSGVNGGALDRLFPLLHPPTEGRYTLSVRRTDGARQETPISVSVPATSVAAREAALAAAGQPAPTEAWTFRIDATVATLTIPTFAFWNGGFDWKAFLDSAFSEMERQHVRRLILDLRRNEGGDSAIGNALLSHLIHAPYTPQMSTPEVSFERAPYALAHYLNTWNFDFFDHTGHVQRTSGRNFRLDGVLEGGQSIQPTKPTFKGLVIALVGPQMSSAGFIISRDLKRSHAAILVGQPTGGSLKGMNGGQLAWLTLPVSGVAVDIPLVAWMPNTPQPDLPILPDVAVAPTMQAAAAGIDLEMQVARHMR
jgi:hypothetical protein